MSDDADIKYTSHIVNENGLKAIHKFLSENHKLGGEHFDDDMILAWAAEAEQTADDGNGCHIEISAWDSVWNRTQVFDLPESCYDIEGSEL